jgi:hypothetical protein
VLVSDAIDPDRTEGEALEAHRCHTPTFRNATIARTGCTGHQLRAPPTLLTIDYPWDTKIRTGSSPQERVEFEVSDDFDQRPVGYREAINSGGTEGSNPARSATESASLWILCSNQRNSPRQRLLFACCAAPEKTIFEPLTRLLRPKSLLVSQAVRGGRVRGISRTRPAIRSEGRRLTTACRCPAG